MAEGPVELSNRDPEQGLALCLSGGGYRAMLFHLGSLIRINELGLLEQLDRCSSVSGGSITASILGLKWNKLVFVDGVATKLLEEVVVPVCNLAKHTIDVPAIAWGTANPFKTIGNTLAGYYDKYLLNHATIQDLPDTPRFVFNSTNIQTGSNWRFSKPYMGDYTVGLVSKPTLALSIAVAASSAFPPFLSPVELRLSEADYSSDDTATNTSSDFRERVLLTDGGVYDNLGLETAWKRYSNILVSDGGRKMQADAAARTDWAMQSRRLIDLLQHQTSNLRRRQVIDSFLSGERGGAYWGVQTDVRKFDAVGAIEVTDRMKAIGNMETRLEAVHDEDQRDLINLAYVLCDAAIRSSSGRWVGDIRILRAAPALPF